MEDRAAPKERELHIALHRQSDPGEESRGDANGGRSERRRNDTDRNRDAQVSGVLLRPKNAVALLVLAHGAGAGMRHAFMEALSAELATRGIATLRFNFPYMEGARRAPDRPPRLIASVCAAIATAKETAGDLPLFAGGKSMGGRMTSLAASEEALDSVAGIVFFGFPLHPAGKPSTQRGDHLAAVEAPMLFLQGTRDRLADLALLEPVCRKLGTNAMLHIVEGADHSFHVLKRSGRTEADVISELGAAVEAFCRERLSA
jgi:predicted alpha/beta-hydrolase family hydrolase